MNYLVDTHILMWSFFEPQRLSETIREIITDTSHEVYYSPVSLWEISIKYALGKLKLNGLTPEEFYTELSGSYYQCKEINNQTIITNYKLPILHKDPFDRFLIWEAVQSDFVLLSVDGSMAQYRKEGLKVVTE
ncbi:MAG: type II toxin-antitoxin system VapC family toxin [Planctomycetaceae bacterium]|nr:type II toxin-antitoxin system VapC family toxin [Planctomycetaceae bacterium]